jgi:hypothetical protein
MDENVEWEPGYVHNSDVPWLKTGRGIAHVASFFTTLQDFEVRKFQVYALMGDGPWVMSLIDLELFYKPTGRLLKEAGEVHVWKVSPQGKVVSMRHACDTRAHAHAACLPR